MDRMQLGSWPTLQQLVGAAERLRRRKGADVRHEDWLSLVEQVRDRLSWRPFVAMPMEAFVQEVGAKERILASAPPADRLIEEALILRLERAIGPQLRPSVHGCRPGRSTFTAAAAVAPALRDGFVALATLDIADFYGSIDRERLRTRLVRVGVSDVVEVVHALASAPLRLRGQIVPRSRPRRCVRSR